MAVQNHIYIYIGKNGAPTILNVDNAADGAVLEQLGALKMPDAMASEVFGENARYADNSTCTITENPDNAEFPFNVAFDATKIPELPKRQTGNLAGMAMPSNDFIDFPLSIFTYTDDSYSHTFNAPANGWAYLNCSYTKVSGWGSINIYSSEVVDNSKILWLAGNQGIGVRLMVPVRKGQFCKLAFTGANLTAMEHARFIYAEGAL